MNRKTAVVLFGGQSSEHVVSCMSVVNVINHMNREKYDILLIGITEEGHWIKVESVEMCIRDRENTIFGETSIKSMLFLWNSDVSSRKRPEIFL